MTADAETYQRAINALAKQNDKLIRENQRLKAALADLCQDLRTAHHDNLMLYERLMIDRVMN